MIAGEKRDVVAIHSRIHQTIQGKLTSYKA